MGSVFSAGKTQVVEMEQEEEEERGAGHSTKEHMEEDHERRGKDEDEA